MTMNQLRNRASEHGYDVYYPCGSPDMMTDDWIGIARSGEMRFCLTLEHPGVTSTPEHPKDLFIVWDIIQALPKINKD